MKLTKKLNRKALTLSVGLSLAMSMGASQAHANNFGSIASNIANSIATLPGLLTAVAYLFGLVLGVLGILKIKDHVENPGQTPLKDGAIRLAAGGALFALPIIFEAMFETVDQGGAGAGASVATMNSATFNVN